MKEEKKNNEKKIEKEEMKNEIKEKKKRNEKKKKEKMEEKKKENKDFSKSELVYDEEGRIYRKNGKTLEKVAKFTDHYYSLRVVKGIPILEIDGVRMHLIKNFENPLGYSKRVCKLLNINEKDRILDTCGGLGYTSIEASKKAKRVISIEKSRDVLEMAKENPYSKKYFKNKNIKIINGDSFEEVFKMENEKFTKIIHDPPRRNFAQDLYSKEFYDGVYRILKKDGLFYHYVGFLGKNRGKKIEEEIKIKLEQSGFEIVKYDEICYGWLVKKGRKA